MFDLVIRNALVADGLGNKLAEADVGVAAGRVAEIGRIAGRARQRVDAEGRVLAPGIVDTHTHYDAQLTWDATASPSPALGVTTVVAGNCGFGIAPATPASRETILANLAVVEGMSLDSLRAGVDWGFASFGEYLDLIAAKGAYPNVAVLASHSSIRTVVMGDDAARREATDDEVAAMVGHFREAMDAGAAGFASSTFENHNGHDGGPMPSRLAADGEFQAFARALGAYDHGLMMATCGARTTIADLEDWARLSGRPAVFAALLHFSTSPERAHGISAACRAARARGVPVYAQAACQPITMEFSLANAYPMLMVEPWTELKLDDRAALETAFADPGFRNRMRASLMEPVSGRIFNGQWDQVAVSRAATPGNAPLEGRTIAEIAAGRGAHPVDVFLDIGLAEDLETSFTAKLLNHDEERVGELIAEDGNLLSLSDAGAHLTFLCDAGYGLHFLGRWVRERGLFDLPGAIRKLSADPAGVYGLVDRGTLTEGAWADMILFDPETVGVGPAERVADLPAGASRVMRRAEGLAGVWVNGARVFDGEDYVDTRPPGQILRRFIPGPPRLAMPERAAAE